MKKISLALIILTLLVLPLFSFAANTLPAQPGTNENKSIDTLLDNILGKVWMVFAAIAIIMFIWAGVKFLTAGGSPEKIQEARQAALWGVVGVVVMILAWSIFGLAESIIGR